MLNYSEGADHCRTNSRRLETSARIILKDHDGTDSFGLFLYYIAYEEMAKAVFCIFVERGWLNEEFITKVFKDHKAKIFLFEEIFRSFRVCDGHGQLGGKRLGEKSLDDFIAEHMLKIIEHRRTTTDFLYVGKTDKWKIPDLHIDNIQEKEKEIKSKINALDAIFQILRQKYDEHASQVDNFRFFEPKEGEFTIMWDEI